MIIKKTFKSVAVVLIGFMLIKMLLLILPFPKLSEFLEKEYSRCIYDRNDNLIQVTALSDGGRREFTPYSKIPKSIVKEIIKQEDRRFFFHHGVDYLSIVSSIIQNKRAGKIVRGGSTISMQLSKIINQDNSVSIRRKLTDVLFAYRIEAKLSKRQILELYLNSIYFGCNAWGVTSGARTYFGCSLNELSEIQVKVLAVIPRNPSFYNPVEHPEHFKLFSEDHYAAAKTAKLFSYPYRMPHFVNYLKKRGDFSGFSWGSGIKLAGISGGKNGAKEKEVHATADIAVYEMANSFLREALEQAHDSRISNASLLLLDNSDGSVLAWIGNADFFDSKNGGQIDGVLVENQPGSSMKPFLYALAIEKKIITPSSVLADVPMEFGNEKLYIPENFNNRFNGPIRARIALASSLNVPAVYILSRLGVENYLEKLYELGFNSLKKNDSGLRSDLGLALGAGAVSLYELVPAFSVFVRDGKFLSPVVVKQQKGKPFQAYSTDTARLICSILSDKAARSLGFGYTQTFQTEYPSIFKTGTSNQYQSIIALGATRNFTIGVWMGNFSGNTVMGKTGSSLPAWVAKNILDKLENASYYRKDLEFPEPEHWHKEKICTLSGMKAGPYCQSEVFEYVKDGSPLSECSWHIFKDGKRQSVLPPEYQVWLKTQKTDAVLEYSSSPLKILTPKDNSQFFFSRMNEDQQAISVEVTGGNSNVLSVYYDDLPFSEEERPFSFKIPVEKGEHKLLLRCGNEEEVLNFSVK